MGLFLNICVFTLAIEIELCSTISHSAPGYYGMPCENSLQCNGNDYSYYDSNHYECLTGRCNCTNEGSLVHFDKDRNQFVCDLYGEPRCLAYSEETDCGANAYCQSRANFHRKWYQAVFRCVCDEGYKMLDWKCHKAVSVAVNELCRLQDDGTINYCDVDANKTCLTSHNTNKCICYKDHFYDSENDVCMTKEMYIEKYNSKAMARFSETCDKMDSPKFCDDNSNMTCKSNICECYNNYFHDLHTNSCLHRTDFILKYNEKALRFNDYCEPKTYDAHPKFCNEAANIFCRNNYCLCKEDYHIDIEVDICLSKEQLIQKYGENVTAGPLDYCDEKHNNGLPKFCGDNANCQSSMCICSVNYHGNFTTKRCELTTNDTLLLRWTHGLYCNYDSECIEGLTCYEHRCACPYPCKYVDHFVACDCGEVSALEGANYAIIVGTMGSIFIVVFWILIIEDAIKKQSKIEYQATSQLNDNPNYDIQLDSTERISYNLTRPSNHLRTYRHSPRSATESNNPVSVEINATTNVPLLSVNTSNFNSTTNVNSVPSNPTTISHESSGPMQDSDNARNSTLSQGVQNPSDEPPSYSSLFPPPYTSQ
ncbi:unnamed protein product [Meganyctiphanes norvegica]|uniref:Uncharacterized protein n=1 Tax=Meganyctiphanes norvegica TaxID=48144 RepID=A0AAV2RNS4_MEGNR